jgi:glycosyltransferase involved in cell wall biosynthesis
VLVVSDALADFLRANSICDVQTLHNGIDPAWASIKQEAVDEFRARYQLNDKRVILQAGRLTGEKGIDCMAELISALGHRRETIRILLVGDITPDAQRILTWSEREGRADLVVATGRLSQDEIKAAYACADVVVVLSRYMDPFPTTNLEAMAFRRPIIGTKYGGTPEAVTNGVSGYIVDPFNAAEYTTKAIRLIDDESLGNRLGEAGRNRLERDFTLKNQTETLLKIFDSVITR